MGKTTPKPAKENIKRSKPRPGFVSRIFGLCFKLTLLVFTVLISIASLIYFFPPPALPAGAFSEKSNEHLFDLGPTASFERVKVKNDDVELNVLKVGKKGDKLVIFLHGFPETALLSWSNQIQYFAKQNKYFILAPDQRGYNTSDKPESLYQYDVQALANDVVDLITHFGYEKGIVVGHDWGGVVAWSLALHHPERVEKLAILNIPHPDVFRKTLSSNPQQLKKSWYMFWFQLPVIAEKWLEKENYERLSRALASSRPGTFSRAEVERYKEAWGIPGALKGMLSYYRRAFQARLLGGGKKLESQRVKPPTLLLFGDQDTALDVSMAQPSIDLCDQGKLKIYEGVTHWIQHEEPANVNKDLEGFFAE